MNLYQYTFYKRLSKKKIVNFSWDITINRMIFHIFIRCNFQLHFWLKKLKIVVFFSLGSVWSILVVTWKEFCGTEKQLPRRGHYTTSSPRKILLVKLKSLKEVLVTSLVVIEDELPRVGACEQIGDHEETNDKRVILCSLIDCGVNANAFFCGFTDLLEDTQRTLRSKFTWQLNKVVNFPGAYFCIYSKTICLFCQFFAWLIRCYIFIQLQQQFIRNC